MSSPPHPTSSRKILERRGCVPSGGRVWGGEAKRGRWDAGAEAGWLAPAGSKVGV